MAALTQLNWSFPILSSSTNSYPLISPTRGKIQKKRGRKPMSITCRVSAISNAETKEREKLKEVFEIARYELTNEDAEEYINADLPFSVEDFQNALENFNDYVEIGTTVRGMVLDTDSDGVTVELEIHDKAPAFLPLEDLCLYDIKFPEEVGLHPGVEDNFLVVDEDEDEGCLILSLRDVQVDLAWERCRQLQVEDVVVRGLVLSANRGGIVVLVEGLRGFVPFSQISTNLDLEDLVEMEISLKFVEVDEEQSRLVLSQRKASVDSQPSLAIGTVVVGTVQTIKPYGAFIDLGNMNGLLHVSQISHDRVTDVGTILQPGDTLKVMILSHDRERSRVSLSTKKLEPTPGDMIRNPKLVYEKADEMAQTFRQRIAQAEAMARADMLRFQQEVGMGLNADGVLTTMRNDNLGLGLEEEVSPAEEN